MENRVVDLLRKRRERIAASREMRVLPDPGPSAAELWEQSWRNEHLKYCMEKVRDLVSEKTFRAFQMLLVDNCTVKDVCSRLGLNPNQVYKAKARVLRQVAEMMAQVDSEARP